VPSNRPHAPCTARSGAASVLAALVLALGVAPARAAAPVADPHAAGYGGETCLRCHDGRTARPALLPEETYDVVIVGGGMAGLSALHYLTDRKVLLLEAEDEAGGQMRQDSWKGIRYAKGAAYFVEPYGVLREFYESERIPMVKITAPENSAWIGGKFYPDCWTKEGRGHMPWPRHAMKAWLKFLEELEDVNDTNRSNQPFDSFDPDQRKLDSLSARDWMRQRGLTDPMIEHIDRYVPSCFGETSEAISASGFANYLSGEIGGNYTLPGGLGAVTEIIRKNHSGKIRLGCRATRVTQNFHEARVTYLGPDGRSHTVRARTVILAVPANLLPELVPDLPADKRAIIAGTRYAAYLVAAVLCNQVFWDDKGYDTWIQGTFFRDIIDATWISRGGKPYPDKDRPHVLSLYIPMGVGGMTSMSDWPAGRFNERILADLEKVVPGSRRKVAGIRLYRWGHSMHVAEPNFMTKSVPVLRKPYYRIHFAGAEIEGLPCNESAILSGYSAARAVQSWLWSAPPASLLLDVPAAGPTFPRAGAR
jgi:monoamine oxidase